MDPRIRIRNGIRTKMSGIRNTGENSVKIVQPQMWLEKNVKSANRFPFLVRNIENVKYFACSVPDASKTSCDWGVQNSIAGNFFALLLGKG